MDCVIKPDAVIESQRGGKSQNVVVSYRSPGTPDAKQFPLRFPTEEVVKAGEDFKHIIFNPLSESYMNTEQSEVQKALVFQASAAVMVRVTQLFMGLVYAVVDTEQHENLTDDVLSLIRGIKPPKDKTAGEKMVDFATKVMNKHNGIKGVKALARYQQRANVNIDDRLYIRTTSLITPYLDKIQTDKPGGVKPPNKATGAMVATIAKNLSAYLGVVSTWENRESPYFMSLLECHAEVIKRMNKLAKHLGVDLGDNFKASFWNSKTEAELVELRKELPIKFTGNEGGMSQEKDTAPQVEAAPSVTPVASAVAQATQTAPTPAPAPQVAAAPKPTPTPEVNAQPAPSTAAPVRLGEISKMAIQNRTDINAFSQQNAQSYVSPLAAAKPNAGTAQPQPTAPAQPQVAPTPGTPTVAPAASAATTSTGKPVVERMPQQVYDANNRALTRRDGSAYMLLPENIPQMKFLQMTDQNGQFMYDSNGDPKLREALTGPGGMVPGQPNNMSPNNFYTGVAQQQHVNPGNPNTFYTAQNNAMQVNQFGASAMVNGQPQVGGGMVPGQPGGMIQTQIMVWNQNRQQVPACFDQQGNPLGQYWTSQGQQITHYNQIAHLVNNTNTMAPPPVNQFNPGLPAAPATGIGKHF